MEKLRAVLKWRWLRALQIWNHLPIRAQGGITVFIPIIALIISFGFALYGNRARVAISEDIERKFAAVRQYGDLLTLMIDAETGERGFLLTNRAEYLAPFKRAVEEIPKTIKQLKATIEAEPGDKPRAERIEKLGQIQDLINRQLASLKEFQDYAGSQKNTEKLAEHLQGGKSLMDEIRARIGEMQNQEQTLLSERIAEINSIRSRDYILIFVVLLIGLLVRVVSFYLFDKGIVRRINRLSEYTDKIIKGEQGNYLISGKTDAVGVLENRIVELGELLENKTELRNRIQ